MNSLENSLESLDGLFDDFFVWLRGQYDAESGGYYYARSSRQFPYRPDIESTAQALQILERCNLLDSMPKQQAEMMTGFFQRKQDPVSGFFYDEHPHMREDEVMIARAIGYTVNSLHKLGSKPLYPLPVSMAQAPSYMDSTDAYRAWLESVSLSNSWRGCDRLSVSAAYVAQLEPSERECYLKTAFDYFDSIQDAKTGLWGEGRLYVKVSGTFKLYNFYRRFGIPIPREGQLYQSILQTLRTDEAIDMCYIRNPLDLLSYMNVSKTAEEIQEIIQISIMNMSRLKRTDGGFSRELHASPPAPNVAQVKALEEYPEIPKPVPLGMGFIEGDMNAGTQAVWIRMLCYRMAGLAVPELKREMQKGCE